MSLRLPLIPMMLALVGSLFASSSLFAFDSEDDLRLLEKARKSEASGSYSRAANFYAEYLRKNRDDLEARDSFNRISRIQQQQVRLQDEQYRKIVVALRPSQVIDLCIYIAEVLGANYVEADRARPEILFHHATLN